MSNSQLGSILITLAVLVAAAHLVGQAFAWLRQPRLVGELLVGVLLGNHVLGRISPSATETIFGTSDTEAATSTVLGFMYWMGLLLLMFVSGTEVRKVLSRENRAPTAWILGLGTPLPFIIAVVIGSFLPLESVMGTAQERTSFLLVLGAAVAVTSIPVISRIFHDLGIMHSRFASLLLGSAILEDLVLWAVLAVATTLAASGTAGEALPAALTGHIAATLGFLLFGLLVGPRLLKQLHHARWNVLQRHAPVAYALVLMFSYTAAASLLDVNLVFAAFLAGLGLVGGFDGSERVRFVEPIDAISKIAYAVFVPIYFILVGFQLQLDRTFSPAIVATFMVGSSVLCLVCVGIAAAAAGFRGLEIVNIAVAQNARGGPGIVLASIAFEAGIINASFFTALVLTAIVTSQVAGFWLGRVVRKGLPLIDEMAPQRVVSAPSIDSRGPDSRHDDRSGGVADGRPQVAVRWPTEGDAARVAN